LDPQVDFGGFGPLIDRVAGAPLSADLTIEAQPRTADGSLSDKQIYRYRLYRDGSGRTSIILRGPASESVPVQIDDPPSQTLIMFDSARRTAARIAPWGSGYGRPNPLREFRGKYSSKGERLGPVEINGIECVRSRGTQTVTERPDGGPDVRAVTETCRSEALRLVLETTTSNPSGDAHVTVTNIQRGEPPPEVFQVPPGYTVVDVPVPGAPPPPPLAR
jgi:hypothetical protein